MLLCACYAHHEVEFEDIPDGCGIEPTFYEGLDCPESVFAVGEFARVDVRHRAGICCESGRNDLVLDELSPHEWELNATWTACGCDELLSCLGPQDAASVRVGPLLEGDNIVHAGEFSCVVVAEASRVCASVPTGVVAPRVLFDDQVFSASVYHEASADFFIESFAPAAALDSRRLRRLRVLTLRLRLRWLAAPQKTAAAQRV